MKLAPNGPWTYGVQLDGHGEHLFVTYRYSLVSVGLYLVDMKSPRFLVGGSW